MIESLLKIRVRQFYRELSGIGLLRLVFLSGLTVFLGFALYVHTADNRISQYISMGFLLLIMYMHTKRGDKFFLQTHFSNSKMLMCQEYMLLSVPLISCFLLHGQWIALAQLAGVGIIVHLDFKTKQLRVNTPLQKFIPSDAIEWKAGFRKQLFIIVPLWIIAASTSFFIGSVPIAIFILGILTLGYFEYCESYQMLLAYELSAKKLLRLKAMRQIQLFSILAVPLIALFLLFHSNIWYVPVAEFLIFCFLGVYAVMTKYAFFEPNTKSPAAQTFLSIGVLGGLIPVFLPVVGLLTIRFYNKSVNHLNFLLDDYDT